jgi:hypothetical protein
MKTPFDPNKPIEALYTQLKSAIGFADAAVLLNPRTSSSPQPTTSNSRRAYTLIRVGIGAVALPAKKRGPTFKPITPRPPKIFEN